MLKRGTDYKGAQWQGAASACRNEAAISSVLAAYVPKRRQRAVQSVTRPTLEALDLIDFTMDS
jgi:hypothetical protein